MQSIAEARTMLTGKNSALIDQLVMPDAILSAL
jgi:hypothetical protein